MTNEATQSPESENAPVLLRGGGGVALLCFIVGAAAFTGMLFEFGDAPQRAFHAYLAAYAFVLSMLLGCMAFLMIAHAANATWPVAVRRLPEAMLAAMPALALLFVPVLLGSHALYPWANPDAYTGPIRDMLEHRQPYMNPTFFGARAIIYLAGWTLLAFLLRRWSFAMDHAPDAGGYVRKLRRLSYAGLPLAALSAGFAAFEWFMSVSPDFASTMFAAMWIAFCLHSGVATTIVLVAVAHHRNAHVAATPSLLHALGRLLLAFLVFLGYTAFFQYMLVWIANRPHEAAWYVVRSRGAFLWAGVFVIFGEFALPFFALLSHRGKRSLRSLAPIALWCLGSLYVHLNWLITADAGTPDFLLDALALISVLALTLSVALYRQRGLPLAAARDPRYSAALAYASY